MEQDTTPQQPMQKYNASDAELARAALLYVSDAEFADRVLKYLWRTKQSARTKRTGVTANTDLSRAKWERDEKGNKVRRIRFDI